MEEFITIFNIIAPRVFDHLAKMKAQDPSATYKEILQQANVKLSDEEAKLLEDIARDMAEGAK